ncbi:uncharacterized protein [Drosophila bipectinata]|uniref:uncharacterized protein n=1 Tax=Drosophila bipectinata TaxID=42026 RepID=UPI001C8A1BDD|nr:uncharacterized protein LOC122322094 [Drosophila bipectinata]
MLLDGVACAGDVSRATRWKDAESPIHHPLLHRGSTAPVQARFHAHRQEGVEMLFRVLPVTLYGNGRQVNTYAFIVDGSSLTLIDAPLLKDLGVKGQPQPLCMQWTAGMHRYEDTSVRLDLRISGIGQTKLYDLRDVHSVQSLDLPSQSLDITHLKAQHTHLRHLPLSGYDSAQPRLLIGLNNCKLGRVLRTKEGTTEEPIAEKTRLGWTNKGRSSNSVGDDITSNYHVFHICACEADENKEILRLLEQCMWSDGGPRPEMNSKSVSNDDQLAIQQLEKNTGRINGRFETGLLLRYTDDKLPHSLPTALKRARCLYQKLTREPELAKKILWQLDEYVKKGYARPITSKEAEEKPYWYLPIFPVLNVNKAGKLRVVCDAAAKTEGISLNTMLLKGPDQLAQLVPILNRFREKRIAIGGDIAEMFHQVRIHTEDQRYQRFVFIDPYTQRRENYAMQCILESHYVDDMLDSVDTEEEAVSLARQVHYIHLQGGFLIRNWVSNSREVLSALGEGAPTLVRLDETTDGQTEKVLGMWWDTKEDLIRYRVSPRYRHIQGRQRPTKREFLSVLMSIYDPLGLISFYVICHMKESLMDSEVEMHTFVDASENGFAAVSCIRFQNEAGIHCSLLGSKTKVAPLRPTSIPRLELMGAVLGARTRDPHRLRAVLNLEPSAMEYRENGMVYEAMEGLGFSMIGHRKSAITRRYQGHGESSVVKNNLLYKLGPYMDSNGILKLDERAKMLKGSDRVVLPCGSHITQLIIKEFHRRFLQANHETVVNELRQKFWIPKLRSTLARIRRSCQQCNNRQAAPKPHGAWRNFPIQ